MLLSQERLRGLENDPQHGFMRAVHYKTLWTCAHCGLKGIAKDKEIEERKIKCGKCGRTITAQWDREEKNERRHPKM